MKIKKVLNKAYDYIQKKLANIRDLSEISVVLVSQKKIKEINNIYRNVDKPTDVLSFENPPEIVLCFKKAKLQAKEKKHSLKSEVALLLIHSLLHILGFDHIQKKQAQKMKNLEKKILSNLNIQINYE